MDERTSSFDEMLRLFLGPNLRELEDIIKDSQRELAQRRYAVELPDADTVDQPIEELASLVARTSNAYGRAARFAGKCKAERTLAQGTFKRKYDQSLGNGSNDAERKANAMATCENEHMAMTLAEAAYEYADYLEQSARVASESARKIYDKVSTMKVAQAREDAGTFKEQDFENLF